MVNVVILQAICIPLFFVYNFVKVIENNNKMDQHNYFMAWVYHVVRIGPYFTNFAYAYVLCHKEGHTIVGMFNQPYRFLAVMHCVTIPCNYFISI